MEFFRDDTFYVQLRGKKLAEIPVNHMYLLVNSNDTKLWSTERSRMIKTTTRNQKFMFIIFVKFHSQINYLIFKVEASICCAVSLHKNRKSMEILIINSNMQWQQRTCRWRKRKRKINKQFSNSCVLRELKYVKLKVDKKRGPEKKSENMLYCKFVCEAMVEKTDSRTWKYYWNAVCSF